MLFYNDRMQSFLGSTRREHATRIARVLRDVRGAGHKRVSPAALAKTACYSPGHFYHIYTKLAGESVGVTLRRRRLDHAAMLLATTRRGIIDIALDSGFESHAGFTRAFYSRFEITPSVFRQYVLQARLKNRAARGFSLALGMKTFLHRTAVNSRNF